MTFEQKNHYSTLEPLFNPKSVAVLGASANTNKIGYLQVKALLNGGYRGSIFPINPRAESIAGLKCYPSLSAIGQEVDLAIFCLGAEKVKEELLICAENNVKAAIIFASGFSEAGEQGQKEQDEISRIARDSNIRLIGPNCVGLLNTTNGLVGTFSAGLTNIPLFDRRDVGFVTQSGAFGVFTYIAAAQNELSFNYFVSVGNEMETEFADIIEYMIHDPKTKVISGYLEGAKDPQKLSRLAKEALSINKPIVLMKTGRSEAGSRAAASHTGSLAGSDKIYDSFFKQHGIVRADDYEDIISFSKLFRSGKLPKGKNTVIVTSSGGRGINEADRCESYGLHIRPLGSEVKKAIEEKIPKFASASNPIDLTAAAAVTNPELYLAPLRELANDDQTDIIIFTEFPLHWENDHPLVEEFIDICKNSDKFVLITTFPLAGMSAPKSTSRLVENGIPVITGDMNPIRALAKLADYSEKYRKNKVEIEEPPLFVDKKIEVAEMLSTHKTLSESEASKVLEAYGIPTKECRIAGSEEEAVEFANSIGYPIVMKVDSPDIPHKTEADAIRLNLKNEVEIRNTYGEILKNAKGYKQDAVIHGIAIQEMLPEGVEVIIGMTHDPVFGPVIMFGLGGVFVEVFQDISFRVAPLTRNDAVEMIEEIKGYKILQGVRGKPAVDIEAIVGVLMNLSALLEDYGDRIDELDINPMLVYEHGIKAADALLVTRMPINEKVEMIGG